MTKTVGLIQLSAPPAIDQTSIGILKGNAADVRSCLENCWTAESLQTLSPNVFLLGDLRISLLSREDGKDRFATVTAGIAKAVNAGFVQKGEVDVDFVQEKLIGTSSSCIYML
jgi:hypothetical protein